MTLFDNKQLERVQLWQISGMVISVTHTYHKILLILLKIKGQITNLLKKLDETLGDFVHLKLDDSTYIINLRCQNFRIRDSLSSCQGLEVSEKVDKGRQV